MDKLNPVEIKERIDFYNKQIEACFYPNKFTLNNVILEMTEEIKKLQEMCPHQYEDNFCIYCYKHKGEN